jgi:hypothetical protein
LQIRADFLSADGKTLASKSHPSILKFKSEPIRFLLTFLKAAPLVAGYISVPDSGIEDKRFYGTGRAYFLLEGDNWT